MGLTTFASVATLYASDEFSFFDALMGPSSPYLSIPAPTFDDQYGYTQWGLMRTISSSGNAAGTSRPMVTTTSGGFLARDFSFRVKVWQTFFEDLIFIGFGEGATNPNFFNEPTNYIGWRIHYLIANSRIDAAVSSGFSSSPFLDLEQGIATYPDLPGGTTFQIDKTGDVLTLSIDGIPSATRTFSVSASAPFLNDSNAHFFFGNTTEMAIFRNLSVTSSLPVSDSDGDGVLDNADACSGTPAGAVVDASGCSGAQNVAAACSGVATWRNHGAYVSCVSNAVEQQEAAGLLTAAEGDAIVSAAAKSSIGGKK